MPTAERGSGSRPMGYMRPSARGSAGGLPRGMGKYPPRRRRVLIPGSRFFRDPTTTLSVLSVPVLGPSRGDSPVWVAQDGGGPTVRDALVGGPDGPGHPSEGTRRSGMPQSGDPTIRAAQVRGPDGPSLSGESTRPTQHRHPEKSRSPRSATHIYKTRRGYNN